MLCDLMLMEVTLPAKTQSIKHIRVSIEVQKLSGDKPDSNGWKLKIVRFGLSEKGKVLLGH